MLSRARKFLQENKNVILDATFAKKENRDKAKKIAEGVNADFKIVEVVCSEDAVKMRIDERDKDESDARFEHYLKHKKLFEPITEEHIIIDNSGTFEDTDKQLIKYF